MQMKTHKKDEYYLGIDIGTNSIGYAAAKPDYELVKFQQHPVWGVHLFDSAQTSAERRASRATRRRFDRKQQRIQLLRMLFAKEISKVDPDFFKRIDESPLKRDANISPYSIFFDKNYTDRTFYKEYPTIHHLICDIIESDSIHDVRLVYIACAWLVAHRGHFFSDVDRNHVDEIFSFPKVYGELEELVNGFGVCFPWGNRAGDAKLAELFKSHLSKNEKSSAVIEYLGVVKNKFDENFPYDQCEFLKMLCGRETPMNKLFHREDYAEYKISLDADDETIAKNLCNLDEDDQPLIVAMKKSLTGLFCRM